MATSVSLFGYGLPLAVVVTVLAVVIGVSLVVMLCLTLGLSLYRSVKRRRRATVRDDLQDGLLERTFAPDPDWSEWVATLSATEREVLESLLDEYLRELDGAAVETLRALGDELGIPARAQRRLEGRGEYARLAALTWLTLLERPDRLRRAEFSPRTPRERAAVTRLRYESDDLEMPAEGVSLLLEGATAQFTVFGQDTLYRVATDEPGALFAVAAENYRAWSEPLLTQVLVVCRHLGTSVTSEDLSWLTATLEHDSEAVRAAAVRALGNVGWREDLREDLFLDRLVEDPSPAVRGAVYETLARWGDDRALSTLTDALRTETDARVRLVGTDALARQREARPDGTAEPFANAWAWSQEHAAYDRVARQRTTQVGD